MLVSLIEFLFSEIDQIEKKKDFTCLNYVFDNLTRLSIKNDKHVLITKQNLIRERYQNYVRYIMSEEIDEANLSFDEEKKVDDFLNHLIDKFEFSDITLMNHI